MSTPAPAGYLLPVPGSDAPLEDVALDTFLQNWVVGVSGLPGTLVFPKWQAVPPDLPANVTWCDVGEVDRTPDYNAAFIHQPTADGGIGQDQLQRHEVLECLASFYGPAAGTYAATFKDGAQVPQNHEFLFLNGWGMVETGPVVNAPAIIKNVWTRKKDVRFWLRRIVVREYGVPNVVEGVAELVTDEGLPPRNIDVKES